MEIYSNLLGSIKEYVNKIIILNFVNVIAKPTFVCQAKPDKISINKNLHLFIEV